MLLDEPTNHFSLNARDALVEGLRSFRGTVVAVSHDMHFLSLLCNELLVVDDSSVVCHRLTAESAVSGAMETLATGVGAINMKDLLDKYLASTVQRTVDES